MMKRETVELLDTLRELKESLRKEGFVIDALFGSYARGDFGPESDIDLLYHIEKPFIERYPGFRAVSRLDEIKRMLAQKLGKSIDLAPSNNLTKTGQKFILAESVDV